MKIKLTEQQIKEITEKEEEKLKKEFEKKVQKLQEELEDEIKGLKKKFQFIEYDVNPNAKSSGKRNRISGDELKKLLNDGKSVNEIATNFNTTTQSIRSKMYNMNLKMKDFK